MSDLKYWPPHTFMSCWRTICWTCACRFRSIPWKSTRNPIVWRQRLCSGTCLFWHLFLFITVFATVADVGSFVCIMLIIVSFLERHHHLWAQPVQPWQACPLRLSSEVKQTWL